MNKFEYPQSKSGNKLNAAECEEIAGQIYIYLAGKKQSAEHLFNIDADEDEQIEAIPMDDIKA